MSQRKSHHDGVVEDSGLLEDSFPDAPPPPRNASIDLGQALSSGWHTALTPTPKPNPNPNPNPNPITLTL